MTADTLPGEEDGVDRGILPQGFTPLDPRFRRLLRIRAAIRSLVLLLAAGTAENLADLAGFVLVGPALVLAFVMVMLLPGRQYASRGYRLEQDGLRTVRGVWRHSDITVPLGRVQHIDVTQKPLERANDLATLVLHTAGTDNASVVLEGLSHDDAIVLRDEVRAGMREIMR
ncbi:PH domain-containing protein [Qipengyuania sp.]|uniref:PH domain-containing protein n=1 Tax=Qipengyuania sp. TaxID=2004515 RepID=UPI0037370651